MRTKIVLCVLIFLSGCAGLRQAALDISVEEQKNVATAREVSANYLGIWLYQSGFIRGALGSNINQLPAECLAAMDELDQLAANNDVGDPNSISDYDLGLSLGLRVRMLSAIVYQALEKYAPKVLEVMPLLL